MIDNMKGFIPTELQKLLDSEFSFHNLSSTGVAYLRQYDLAVTYNKALEEWLKGFKVTESKSFIKDVYCIDIAQHTDGGITIHQTVNTPATRTYITIYAVDDVKLVLDMKKRMELYFPMQLISAEHIVCTAKLFQEWSIKNDK